MEIDFGQKLVSKSLDDLVAVNWEKSFHAKTVIFNCSELEWISNSEIAFFFSWIKALENLQISVSIQMQSSYGIEAGSDTFTKRKYCLERLLVQWRLRSHVSPRTTILDGGIQADTKSVQGFSDYSAIPIQEFHAGTFDQDFENIFKHYLLRFTNNLRAAVRKTDINYYDSQFLDYSVFKELYSNVCLHSSSSIINECFFSIGLNKKFVGNSTYLSESRLSELSDAELDFFSENGRYRNIDFVEMTFHDFGIGIAKTLHKNYDDETLEMLKEFFGTHFTRHIAQQHDTKIIEYALLLFTSRFEIERKLDIHGYIPRGLYIIKELVKQYHGYFEVSSLQGSVGLSFKDGRTHLSYKKNNNARLIFPGTKIKIVFPALDKEFNVQQETADIKPAGVHGKTGIIHIHFLKEFCDAETQLRNGITIDSQDLQQKIVARFFSKILDNFRKAPEYSLIMIDFAGAEPSTIDFYNKFIYFITHFPLYGRRRLVFYNVFVKGLNRTVILEKKDSLNAKGIIASTIPCINIDHSIEWLGIHNLSDAEHFTQVWKEDEAGTYSFSNLIRYNSTLINVRKVSNQYKIELNLPSYNQILHSIDESITIGIESELQNRGVHYYSLQAPEKTNYNHISVSKSNTCYLNARGKLVLSYISFTEKLYIISYRRMIAAYFVFKLYLTLNESQLKKLNKILSVTLSSQMIGHEVALMIGILQNSEIKLVALSNYYNFQNEEKFSDITPKSKVLIVNDVISTGGLTNNIIKSIEIADAFPVCCLAIVNLSTIPINTSDIPIISLAKESVNYLEKVPEGYEIEVINPVMNVPTEMPKAKSKENVLMTKEQFLSRIDKEYLVLGNLKNNSVYFSYFLNTRELLANDRTNGYPLINELLTLLRMKKQSAANTEIQQIVKGIDIVSKNVTEPKARKGYDKVKKELRNIIQSNSPGLFDEYKIDVVFYPFLSNISVIEQDITPFVESKLNNSSPKIFPIPRIMTTKGWRFSFPPKFLDYLFDSSDLSVLILDDGALSGETIMQMIDSVSFLSVKSIDVLSIFGRVEDFQKEFFSRIKSVQVKNSVIPITVFFGVHVNIPVHNQFDSSFQTEYREILALENKLINGFKIELSDQFENYLNRRKERLQDTRHPSVGDENYHLFPCVSKIKVFELRDFIGRFGSYRLYIDDLPLKDIDQLISSREDLLAMLTVLNLEPQLYQTFKRMFREDKIHEKIQVIVNDFLTSPELMSEEWMKEFFIKALFYLSSKWFFTSVNILRLVKQLYQFSKGGYHESFKYLEYTILLVALGIKNTDNAFEAKSFEGNIEEFISELKLSSEEIFLELRLGFSLFHQIQSTKDFDHRFYINKYHYLRNYFTRAKVYEDKHDDKLLPNNFGDLLKAVSELKYSIEFDLKSDIMENTDKLYFELEKLRDKYSEDLNFRFINEIVNNLHHFASTDLPFNVVLAISVIHDLESLLNLSKPSITPMLLQHIFDTLGQYKGLLLRANCEFASYVLNATGHLMDEWKRTEAAFIKMPGNERMVMIDYSAVENIAVNVHPYALNLAFENILKNKRRYAEKILWRMSTIIMKDFTELVIEQDSAFDRSGDGTGQSAIKSILRCYGVQYRRIKDNPYTLKITFSNKLTEDERP